MYKVKLAALMSQTQPGSEIDIHLHRLDVASEWHLVSVGLTLVQAGMVVFLAAALVGIAAIGVAIRDPAFTGSFFSGARPLLIVAFFVALAALLTAFLGVCLCWNAPAGPWLRNRARACVAVIMLSGLAPAIAISRGATGTLNTGLVPYGVVFWGGLIAMTLWVLFLKGVADFFDNESLQYNAGRLLCAASWGLTLNAYLVLPVALIAGVSHKSAQLWYILPMIVPVSVFLWHLMLVSRIRHAIPLRNHQCHCGSSQ